METLLQVLSEDEKAGVHDRTLCRQPDDCWLHALVAPVPSTVVGQRSIHDSFSSPMARFRSRMAAAPTAMSASHYHLDNLIAIVDYNKVMAKGFVWDLMSIEPLAEKWRAFGWDVIETDGQQGVIAHWILLLL